MTAIAIIMTVVASVGVVGGITVIAVSDTVETSEESK